MASWVVCEDCDDEGQVVCWACEGIHEIQDDEPCWNCGGNDGWECITCEGQGGWWAEYAEDEEDNNDDGYD